MYREGSHLLMEVVFPKKICTEGEDLEAAQAPFHGLSPRGAAPQEIRGGHHSQHSVERAEHLRSSWSVVLTRLLRVRRPDPEDSPELFDLEEDMLVVDAGGRYLEVTARSQQVHGMANVLSSTLVLMLECMRIGVEDNCAT